MPILACVRLTGRAPRTLTVPPAPSVWPCALCVQLECEKERVEWDRIRAEHEVESLRSSQSAESQTAGWPPRASAGRRRDTRRPLDDAPRGGRPRATSAPDSVSIAPSFILGSSNDSVDRRGREWAEDWARRREAESQSMREAEWERELERELLEGSQAPGGASLEVGSTCTARTAAAAAAAFAVVSRASKAAKNVDPGETGLRARGGFEPRLE